MVVLAVAIEPRLRVKDYGFRVKGALQLLINRYG